MTKTIFGFSRISACLSLFFLSVLTLLISGCGKNETAGGVVGTGAGAAIGTAVAGRHSRGTGALIGGLIGNVIGTTVGRAADDEEREQNQEQERRVHARQQALANREISRVKQENRVLKQTIVKWCSDCNREVNLVGANSCPACGGDLIREKNCRMCAAVFSPKSGYRYCPYCREGVLLSAR